MSGDPLWGDAGLTGVLAAFQGGEPFVVHGSLDRLPAWMQSEGLQSIDGLDRLYTGRILYGRRDCGPRSTLIPQGSVAALIAAGEALYLPDVAEAIPDAAGWLRDLEQSLGIPAGSARATAWVAPAGEGTAEHLDAEDVISIQLLGRKSFAVAEPAAIPFAAGFQYGPGIPAAADLYPQAAHGFPKDAEYTTVDLRPGSLVVLPRGHWHHTRCQEVSIALSVIVSPPTLLDWMLGVLRHRGLEATAWRRPLYGTPDAAAFAQSAADLSALAAALEADCADGLWNDGTTLQWIPTKVLEYTDRVELIDRYDGSRRLLELTDQLKLFLTWQGSRSSAYTVAEARRVFGASIDAQLQSLVQAGALYRWPVSRRPT